MKGCLLLLFTLLSRGKGDSWIYIQDNAYQNVVIVIGEGVKEDWGLVDKIKQVITDASDYLYTVTR